MRHVEPEAVHAVGPAVRVRSEETEPVIVHRGHLLPEPGVRVVQLRRVRPVAVVEDPALRVLHVELGMLGDPPVVAARVIRRDVENDPQMQLVRAANELGEFVLRSVFRVHAAEIADGVGRADALAAFDAHGIRRHQVQHIDAQFLDRRQVGRGVGQRRKRGGFLPRGLKGVARLPGRQRAEVDLVDDG